MSTVAAAGEDIFYSGLMTRKRVDPESARVRLTRTQIHSSEPKGAETTIYLSSQGISLHSRYSARCIINASSASSIQVECRADPWPYLGGKAPRSTYIYIRTLCLVLPACLRGKQHGGTDCEVSPRPCSYAGREAHVQSTWLSHVIFLTRGSLADKSCVEHRPVQGEASVAPICA